MQTISADRTVVADVRVPTTVRALLLDDSSFDRARIRRLSRQSGMDIEIDEVGSIRELEAAVKRDRYDLVLVDYRLPEGDGMQALDHVLRDPRNRDAGKIMITGNGAMETAVQAMRGGCHDFLTKDEMDAEALHNAMRNAMTLARERQELEMRAAHQREVIRDGLIAALSDREVQGNVISLMRDQLRQTLPDRPQFVNVMDPGDVDMLLAGLSDTDEFIFH